MKGIEKLLEAAAALLISAGAIVLLIEVLARYVLKVSLTWPEELARYTLVWLTFVGAGVGAAKGRLIVTQAFTDMLPKETRHWVRVVTTVLGIAAVAVALSASQPLFESAGDTASPATGIHLRWVFLAFPVGGAAIILFLLRSLLELLRGREAAPAEAETAAILEEYVEKGAKSD